MFCTNCGKEIPDDSKFCGLCGAPVLIPVPEVPAAGGDEPSVPASAGDEPAESLGANYVPSGPASASDEPEDTLSNTVGVWGQPPEPDRPGGAPYGGEGTPAAGFAEEPTVGPVYGSDVAVKPRRKKTTLWIIIGVIALLIAAAVALFFLYSRTENRKSSSDDVRYVDTFNILGWKMKEVTYGSGSKITGSQEFSHDFRGRITKISYFDENGKLTGWAKCTVDASGNPVRLDNYDASGKYLGWSELEYKNGVKTAETGYREDGAVSYEYSFYSDGSIEKKTDYDEKGAMTKETAYDTSGNPTDTTSYAADGSVSSVTSYQYDGGVLTSAYEYDGSNQLIESMDYNADGTVSSTTKNEYNADGVLIKSDNYTGEDTLNSEYLYYSSNGSKKAEIMYGSDGKITSETVYSTSGDSTDYTFDADGKAFISNINSYSADSSVSLTTYNTYPIELDSPVYNCTGFDISFEVTGVSEGSPYGEFSVYVKLTSGSWNKVGTIYVPDGDEVNQTISFGRSLSFGQIAVVPSDDKDTSWSHSIDASNFAVEKVTLPSG